MNIVILIIATLVLIASLFWFFSKKGVWERGISVLTSLSSIIVLIWQLYGTPATEKQVPTISAEGNVNSPITGYVENQTNNYYPPPQDNTKEKSSAINPNKPKKIPLTVSLIVNSKWSNAKIFVDKKPIFPTNNALSIKTIEIQSGTYIFQLVEGFDTCTVSKTIKTDTSKVIFTCQ